MHSPLHRPGPPRPSPAAPGLDCKCKRAQGAGRGQQIAAPSIPSTRLKHSAQFLELGVAAPGGVLQRLSVFKGARCGSDVSRRCRQPAARAPPPPTHSSPLHRIACPPPRRHLTAMGCCNSKSARGRCARGGGWACRTRAAAPLQVARPRCTGLAWIRPRGSAGAGGQERERGRHSPRPPARRPATHPLGWGRSAPCRALPGDALRCRRVAPTAACRRSCRPLARCVQARAPTPPRCWPPMPAPAPRRPTPPRRRPCRRRP